MRKSRSTPGYDAWAKKSRKRRRKLRWGRILLLLLIVIVIIFGLRFALSTDYRLRTMQSVYSAYVEQFDPAPELAGATLAESDELRFKLIEGSEAMLHSGDLILVNYAHAYDFQAGGEEGLVELSTVINNSYSVYGTVYVRSQMAAALNGLAEAFAEETGNTKVRVISGYRSEAYQQNLYENKVEEIGEVQAAEWVARPGHSEHHTGLAVDVGIASGAGAKTFTNEGTYAWYCDNAMHYGLINRYAEHKQELTRIMGEPWHYRYVGVPHAALIVGNGYCLEEYIIALKNYEFMGQHLQVTDAAGAHYEIYFVPAEDKIPVPTNRVYDISGNNDDGYIITVHLDETK